jgi:hypothetical protein
MFGSTLNGTNAAQRSLSCRPLLSESPNRAETIVLREHFSLLKVVGRAFRARDEDLLRAPSPERWVDLIKYLNEVEREASRPENEARRKSSEARPHPGCDP